jgi:heavy metal sensor kinase
MTLQLSNILRSFRFHIAFLSTCLSGLVLVTFCVGAWLLIRQVNLKRVDEDIRRAGIGPLSTPQAPGQWVDFDEAIRFVLGEEQEDSVIMLVKGRDNQVLYASSNWPAELSPEEFAPPSGPEPVPPVRGPGWRRGRNEPGWWADEPRPPGAGPPPQLLPETGRTGSPPWGDDFPPRERGPRGRFPGGPGAPPPLLPLEMHRFFTAPAGGNEWRVGVMSNPHVTFVLGRNMSRFRDEMRALRTGFLVALPAALLLIAVGGWWVSQRALRPVRRITAAAEGITARGLDQRIPHSNEDVEFNRLISVFNGMMDRLEKSFQQAVRFSADAAHELKTPLTILQGELEQALQAAPPGSPQQQAYGALLEEVQRLKVIIRKLLLLSLADSGQLKPNFETLDLSAVMQAAIEDAAILAPGLRIEHTIEPGITVAADGDLLRQVVQNLVSNAIKYNRPEGTVSFVLRRAGANVLLTVSNTGAGIPPEDRGKVFERFYRGDKARNRNVDGLGLGLSLSREIARAHHGDLVLENTPGGTTVFTLILPGITSTTGASNALT